MIESTYLMVFTCAFVLMSRHGYSMPQELKVTNLRKTEPIFVNDYLDYQDAFDPINNADNDFSDSVVTGSIRPKHTCQGKLILCSESEFECKPARNWKNNWPRDLNMVNVNGNCCYKVFSKGRKGNMFVEAKGQIQVVDFAVWAVKKVCCRDDYCCLCKGNEECLKINNCQ